MARAAFSAGGHGYVVKSDAESDLLAIEMVLSGKKFVSRSLALPAFANIGDLHEPTTRSLAGNLARQRPRQTPSLVAAIRLTSIVKTTHYWMDSPTSSVTP